MSGRSLAPNPIHKKAFPLHVDSGQYYPDEAAVKALIDEQSELESVLEGMDSSFMPPPRLKRYYRRHNAQMNDPIALFYVVEMIIRQQRGTYIRPYYLAPTLSREQPLYYWGVRAIGRMLSGLSSACKEEYREINTSSMLEDRALPFAKGRDAKGVYYVTDPLGGTEGVLWLMNVRKVLMKMIDTLMEAEIRGNFNFTLGNKGTEGYEQNLASPWVLYGEWFENTQVRTTEQYMAQCDGQPFLRSQPARKGVAINDPLA